MQHLRLKLVSKARLLKLIRVKLVVSIVAGVLFITVLPLAVTNLNIANQIVQVNEVTTVNSYTAHRIQPQSQSAQIKTRPHVPRSQVNTFSNADLIMEEKPKVIAIATLWYGTEEWLDGNDTDDTKTFRTLDDANFTCPQKCLYTRNIDFVATADLVIASIVDMKGQMVIPTQRPPDQLWAAFICESPANVNVIPHLGNNNNLFNWSVSYRLDSDVYWPSGHFHKRRQPLPESQLTPTLEQVKSKKKLAAWIVSNCNTRGKREEIIRDLKYSMKMEIDVYGRCGQLKCPEEGNCREHIYKDYKFYIAFENSLCLDYVTEKFYEAFAYDMVPITYGISDYSVMAPPHSYINLLDFNTTEEFVQYIKYLDANPEEYLKYFQWKKDYEVFVQPIKSGLCNTCVKLHEHAKTKGKPKQLNFSQWWTTLPTGKRHIPKGVPLKDSVCLTPEDIGFV